MEVHDQLSEAKKNAVRVHIAIIDYFTQILRDLLSSKIAAKDLYINNVVGKYKTSDKGKCFGLWEDIFKKEGHLELIKNATDYSEFDITLLCLLLRNFCTWDANEKPSSGWGAKQLPGKGEETVGDDIERIRLLRNKFYGHISTFEISDREYENCWTIISDVCERMEKRLVGTFYCQGIKNLEKQQINFDLFQAMKKCFDKNTGDLKNEIRDNHQEQITWLQGLKDQLERIEEHMMSNQRKETGKSRAVSNSVYFVAAGAFVVMIAVFTSFFGQDGDEGENDNSSVFFIMGIIAVALIVVISVTFLRPVCKLGFPKKREKNDKEDNTKALCMDENSLHTINVTDSQIQQSADNTYELKVVLTEQQKESHDSKDSMRMSDDLTPVFQASNALLSSNDGDGTISSGIDSNTSDVVKQNCSSGNVEKMPSECEFFTSTQTMDTKREICSLLNSDEITQSVFKKVENCLDSAMKLSEQSVCSTSKHTILQKLRKELLTCKKYISGENKSPECLVETASAGKSLQGILFDKSSNCFRGRKFQIVQLKNKPSIVSAKVEPFTHTLDFTSHDQSRKNIDSNLPENANSVTDLFDSNKIFMCRKFYYILPLRVWEPCLADLSFTRNSRVHLQEIEKFLLQNDENSVKKAENKCRLFFDKFGSHFLKKVYIGGVHKIKAVGHMNEENTSSIDEDTLQNIVQKRHAQYVSDRLFGMLPSEKSEDNITHFEHSRKMEQTGTDIIKIDISFSGEPKGVSVIPLWKRAISGCNKNWRVINIPKPNFEDCVGIWSLIEYQPELFEDSKRLSNFLLRTWVHFFLGNLEEGPLKSWVESVEKKFMNLIETICHQTESDKTGKSYLSHISCLENRVQKLREWGLLHYWIKQCEENPNITNMLKRVANLALSGSQKIETVRYLYNLLTCLESNTFQGEKDIKDWMKNNCLAGESTIKRIPLNSINDLIGYIDDCLLTTIRHFSPMIYSNFGKYLRKTIQKSLRESVVQLENAFMEKKDCPQYVLLKVIMWPFELNSSEDQAPLDLIAKCSRQLKMETSMLNVYVTESRSAQESWIFQRLISKIESEVEPQNDEKAKELFLKEIQDLKKKDIPLTDSVKNALSATDRFTLEELCEELVKISGISWMYFEKYLEKDKKFNFIFPTEQLSMEKELLLTVPEKFLKFIKTIGLSKYYPERISVRQVLEIRDVPSSSKINNLPWIILKKIISNNYEFYDEILYELLRNSSTKSSKTKRGNYLLYHPSDIFLAMFKCFDPFLKSLIAQKMAMCQLAIPLIYRDFVRNKLVFGLWPLREILLANMMSVATAPMKIVTFLRIGSKQKATVSKSKMINQFLRQNTSHNTFFQRAQPLGCNKRLFSEGVVEISWYCPSSIVCDRGKINEPLAILNLRGDAHQFPEQANMLLKITNVLVLFINYDDINKTYISLLRRVHHQNIPVILITEIQDEDLGSHKDKDVFMSDDDGDDDDDENMDGKEEEENKTEDANDEKIHEEEDEILCVNAYERKMSDFQIQIRNTCMISTQMLGKRLNESEMKRLLIAKMTKCLQDVRIFLSIEESAFKIRHKISVDEDNDNCLKGKKLSWEFFSNIEYVKESMYKHNIREQMLLLQGPLLWHKWSDEQKRYHRAGTKDSYSDNTLHNTKMQGFRRRQIYACNDFGETMSKFVQILLDNANQQILLLYFLSWLRQSLDAQSRLILQKLQREHFQQFKQQGDEKSKMSEDKNVEGIFFKRNKSPNSDTEAMMEQVARNLENASFGLEHFIREMGQIYEAFLNYRDTTECTILSKTMHVLCALPTIAAELLLLSQPLEIMDGDAENVPSRWLRDVFQEVERLIGKEKTIFSISILGIQSSGKSTLLNTMFGLQFAVSAGRCTRGIYFQLLPINRSQSSFNFDYVMIIDTEGLRSQGKGNILHHDNELATLGIGLADVAIINIKGETIADMENVLQMVVHAIVRLKRANPSLTRVRQSCLFVHQNVSSENADMHLYYLNQQLVENLNEMAAEVASEEQVSNVTSFSDVIDFDSKNHIKYICDLWHGSPPMDPVSTKYSMEVENLSSCILKNISAQRQGFLTISEINYHLQDLWQGILSENFVFSFRNTLEVKAFSLLDMQYRHSVWKMEECKLTWIKNRIGPDLLRCKDENDLIVCTKKLQIDFSDDINFLKQSIEQEINNFIDKSQLKELMAHWKGRKKIELHANCELIFNDFKQKLSREQNKCKIVISQSDHLLKDKREVVRRATECAEKFKGSRRTPSKKEIGGMFLQKWTDWLDELAPMMSEDEKARKREQIDLDMISVIYDTFKKDHILINKYLPKTKSFLPIDGHISLPKYETDEEDISAHNEWRKVRQEIRFTDKKQMMRRANAKVDAIYRNISQYLETLATDVDYDITQFSHILQIIIHGCEEHNKDSKKHGFKLTQVFQVRCAIFVSKYVFQGLVYISELYELNHCPWARINAHKREVRKLFVGICLSKANEVLATDVICAELIPVIQEKIERDLSIYIPNTVVSLFENRKYPLILAIMKDLAEKENNFDEYQKYIWNSGGYSLEWITKYTKDYFDTNDRFKIYVNRRIEQIVAKISAAVSSAASVTPKSIKEWINHFCTRLSGQDINLIIKSTTFELVKSLKLKNLNDMSSQIIKRLEFNEKKLKFLFSGQKLNTLRWKDETPYQVIFKNLWGCEEQCPWCYEPCIWSSSNDIHTCVQHRPNGIVGKSFRDTQKLVCETCNFEVQSTDTTDCSRWCGCTEKECQVLHPCSEFTTKYSTNWKVQPNPKIEDASVYWSWVMSTYDKQFAEYHGKEMPDIPREWRKISKEHAIKSLQELNFSPSSNLTEHTEFCE